jgi:hypothetical protein
MTIIAWMVIGAVAGSVQLLSLARTVRLRAQDRIAVLVRVSTLVGVFVVAALRESVWPAIVGWSVGFIVTSRRLRSTRRL